ncbi:class I SAM-dependent methyltransferase [Novosphingobium sp. YJ-S2-02]|uniref:Class I SAM-dependent methyltransferase n=1 Tax=Novosphingobium aureum TaxID=2792964 RepID=A0A931HEC1_9SPHN|nr:class I SAM-dependent methyltransferase [Novosphingobium aureum]MBH0113868.1 class I SAM-dependent methyltransferase [Novosphingobium aureum]
MRRFVLTLSTALGLAAAPAAASAQASAAGAPACAGCETLLELAADAPARKDDKPRDAFRHPVETMAFMGVRPDMKVGEYAPGGGWYTRFLAPYLGKSGKLVGLYFAPDSAEGAAKAEASAAGFAEMAAKASGEPATQFAGYTLSKVPEGEEGTFDRIVLVRMLHNMTRANVADAEVRTMRKLLKPGGMLGVVQHRAKADAPFSYTDGSKGYMREADIVKFMEINGFDLVSKSEINANPKDSADWAGGVWTLPPTYALKDQDKAKYAAIGESDRMTLLFRKRD